MKLKIYQVDAFADNLFSGNPAAVVPLNFWLSDNTMQLIAEENNLSETAFFVRTKKTYHIRWFTPNGEVKLCGHATLASAYVIFNFIEKTLENIEFSSLSGILNVKRDNNFIELDFPSQKFIKCQPKRDISDGLGKDPSILFKGEDYFAIFDRERDIEEIKPNFEILSNLDLRGVVISAKSQNYDFVSRAFYPKYGINEDPVTGSAHTMLIAYWSKILNKNHLKAKQVSKRGGILNCINIGDRVQISGKSKLYMIGDIFLEI